MILSFGAFFFLGRGLARRSRIHVWLAVVVLAQSLTLFAESRSIANFDLSWYTARGLATVATLAILLMLIEHLHSLQGNLEREIIRTEQERRRADRAPVEAHRLATTDLVTGLPNRARFAAEVHAVLTRTEDSKPRADGAERRSLNPTLRTGLVMLDLDNFKEVNDQYGHVIGDLVLRETANRLVAVTRDHDQVYRLGGDEFALVFTGRPNDEGVLDQRLARIAERLRLPIKTDSATVATDCSIGVAFWGRHGFDADQLLQRADLAMYAAKQKGRGQIVVFDESMESRARQRLQDRKSLESGLGGAEFGYHYQPISDLRTNSIWGAEALLRWYRHGHVVPAADFISIAEETGLLRDITGQCLTKLLNDLPQLIAGLGPKGTVTLNLSVDELADEEIVGRLLGNDFSPWLNQLMVEVTESVMLESDSSATRSLSRLRNAGVRLAIDDLGTGYSNFNLLHYVEPSLLKIDRSFITGTSQRTGHPVGEVDAVFIQAAAAIGAAMTSETLAEGIESAQQLDLVRELGVDLGQGYWIGHPMAIADLLAWLALPQQRAQSRSVDELVQRLPELDL